MPRQHFLILGALYLAVCAFYFFTSLAVTEPGYPLDDAWIHQVFARNIATGHGFSFNPDIPISGATAPLWTLVMALLWPIFGPITGGISAGVILEFLAIIAIYKLTRLVTGEKGLALIVSILSILTWILVWGALSGMEIGLYSALSIWGLYFYFKAQSFEDKNNYIAYALFALAFLSRPECALFLAGAGILDLIIWIRSDHKKIIPWLGRIVPVALFLAPYFAFNYSVTGSLFTQTFAAKEQGKGLLSGLACGDLKRVLKAFSVYPYYYFQDFIVNIFLLSPLLLPASIAGGIKFAAIKDKQRSKRITLAIVLLFYVPLMGTFAPVLTATYHRMRLIDNLIPIYFMFGVAGLFWNSSKIIKTYIKYLTILVCALAAGGLVLLVADDYIVRLLSPILLQNISRARDLVEYDKLTWYARESGKNSLFLAVVICVGALLCLDWVRQKIASRAVTTILIVLIAGYGLVTLLDHAGIYANDVKNINDMDKKIGIYLQGVVSKDQKVAVNDIGAISYFSGMRILDLKGLVSPEITRPMISNDSLAFEYMFSHDRVDYVAIFPIWFKYIPARTDIFKPLSCFGVEWNSILAGDTTIVYKAEWPKNTR